MPKDRIFSTHQNNVLCPPYIVQMSVDFLMDQMVFVLITLLMQCFSGDLLK